MSNTLKIAAAGLEAAPAGYQISRSLRFNSADSAYLSRTPAGSGNRKTWTWSAWVKRSNIYTTNAGPTMFSAGPDGANFAHFNFLSFDSNKLDFFYSVGNVIQARLTTTALYRDASAFYHIVLVLNTDDATANDRIILYVNGERVTALSTYTAPSLGTTACQVNATNAHYIGRSAEISYRFYDGYLADVFFVDGQALTADDFGETDATTGVWKPKAYAGTYGTNGFHLDFSDNTSTTTLGYDAAGSNDWTLNNFSVTAGAGNDSLVDTPTPYGTDTGAGGEVRGNYATLNPLNANSSLALANGNLNVSSTGNAWKLVTSTIMLPSTGKWYVEVTQTSTSQYINVGVVPPSLGLSTFAGSTADSWSWQSSAQKYTNNTATTYGTTAQVDGDVIMFAIDRDNGNLWAGKNGTWFDSSNPATNTNEMFSGIPSTDLFVSVAQYATASCAANFGQRPFAYTAPSGYKCLCTTNLPTPTIADGGDYFNTILYTGNGTTQSITGVGFQPDWVWVKQRNGTRYHSLYDAVRGPDLLLRSNDTAVEVDALTTGLTSFDSDGFSVGLDYGLNEDTYTYVGWNWNAGGSNATNTDGTITSTVRANTTAGFSVVSYTGNGTRSGQTVGHGLGVAPSMIIHKPRSTTGGWFVTHSGIPNAWILLNTTDASQTGGGTNGTLNYQSTNTSTVFSFIDGSSSINNVNGSGTTYIAYCFSEVTGYSKFSSYTGNGSTDGPFVYCGFTPAFVMIKIASGDTGSWAMFDVERNTFNVCSKEIAANESAAEYDRTNAYMDILSNGFKLRNTDKWHNQSGSSYIFMAFAENPFKYSLAR